MKLTKADREMFVDADLMNAGWPKEEGNAKETTA